MLKVYRQRLIIGLMTLIIVFAIVFLIALLNLKKGQPLFDSGMGLAENWAVMIMSILGIIKAIHEIIRVEHSKDLNKYN
ncbi:MAG: hypothetical protein KJ583_04535 [Nanoarchaeota archaeon]|nr:hypothetical protein [Nanoarchaeota archaeon]MBU1270023.1 hypothetical protein [Nanoarchaeota archaeon]MBU1604559.1 hypothetical protein [Nanoarchaeota archaeon]MBU2443627.1 hypothetical protein [Nanoarchaeota archaeon]